MATATASIWITFSNLASNPTGARFYFEQHAPSALRSEDFMIEIEVGEEFRSFGPYLLTDAEMYGQHAAIEPDPIAWLEAMDKRHAAARYPGNDWTGLLNTLKR